MAQPDRSETFDMESLVGYVLLIGVGLSVVLIVAGLVWNLIATGSLQAEYSITGTNLTGFAASVLRQTGSGRIGPHTILNLGICVLLLTPFTRVLTSVIYFALGERNWKYAFFTSFVLAVLTYSLFLR